MDLFNFIISNQNRKDLYFRRVIRNLLRCQSKSFCHDATLINVRFSFLAFRIFKLTSPAVQENINLLHASVLSMVEFDDDIFAAGHCFDWNQYPTKKGLFCPFAHRLPPPEVASLAKDLANEYHYLGNTSEWFFLARKNAEKVIAKNEQYIKGNYDKDTKECYCRSYATNIHSVELF